MPRVVDYYKDNPQFPNVIPYEYLSLCTDAGAEFIKEAIRKNHLDRIIVAACTPRTHLPVFQATLKDMDMSPNMLEFVNIREHCSFVHQREHAKALQKSIELINAALGRAKYLEHVPTKTVDVAPTALVVGGGIAGLSAAIDLANQGFDVTLVEEKSTIGGRMAQLDRTFPTDDCSI